MLCTKFWLRSYTGNPCWCTLHSLCIVAIDYCSQVHHCPLQNHWNLLYLVAYVDCTHVVVSSSQPLICGMMFWWTAIWKFVFDTLQIIRNVNEQTANLVSLSLQATTLHFTSFTNRLQLFYAQLALFEHLLENQQSTKCMLKVYQFH